MQSDLFTSAAQKSLQEKTQEKRTIGVNEVQNKMSQAIAQKDDKAIRNYIEFFKQWIIQPNQSQKKAGLYTFQLIANVLMKEGGENYAQRFVIELTNPILEILDDKDKVTPIENLYYLGKTFGSLILTNFKNICDSILNKAADSDDLVKRSYQQLDHQMKTILNEALPQKKYFNVEEFVVMLEQKLKTYKSQQAVKSAVISWIKTLHDIESVEMYQYLPKLAGRLFTILGDQEAQLRSQVDHLIGDFQKVILVQMKKPSFDHQITSDLIDILIKICQTDNNYAKLTAVVWIYEYLRLFQQSLDLSQEIIAGNMLSSQKILQQVEPKQSFSNLNDSDFKKVIFSKIPSILEPILKHLSHEEKEIRRAAQKTNELLLQIMERVKNTSVEFMNLFPVVKDMLTNKNSTAEQALIWMDHLLRFYSEKLLPTIDSILQRVFEKLNDAEGPVLQNVMKVLGSISMHEKYFDLVIDKILDVFYYNQELRKKSDTIIKKFCSLLNPARVYTAFAAKIMQRQDEYDTGFICTLVQTLEQILVTDKDLQDLRQILRNLRYEENKQEENIKVFEALFSTFSFNPVSTITLCFLVEEYELAYNIIMSFSEIEIDMDTLQSIAKIVNILESPIFVYLRLQLLESNQHPYLLKSLYGLMMLLPQGVAFNKLRQRLKNVNQDEEDGQEQQFENNKKVLVEIDQQKLLNIFRKTRQLVNDFKKENEGREII